MDHSDVILSLLAAVAMAGLTSLGLVRIDKEGAKTKVELDTADVDIGGLDCHRDIRCHDDGLSPRVGVLEHRCVTLKIAAVASACGQFECLAVEF